MYISACYTIIAGLQFYICNQIVSKIASFKIRWPKPKPSIENFWSRQINRSIGGSVKPTLVPLVDPCNGDTNKYVLTCRSQISNVATNLEVWKLSIRCKCLIPRITQIKLDIFELEWCCVYNFIKGFSIDLDQGLLNRWTSQLDLGNTTGWLERVHNST